MKARPPRPSAASSEPRCTSAPARRRSNILRRMEYTRVPWTQRANAATSRASDPSSVCAPHDPAMLGRSSSHRNGLRETLRRSEVEEPVQVHELPAIQPVKLGYRILRVVIAEPP